MKPTLRFAIASLLAASVSSAALAQVEADVDVDAEVDTGAEVETGAGNGAGVGAGAGVEAGAGAGVGVGADGTDAPNYGQVISSLRAAGGTSAEIEALNETATVRIILLSELRGQAAENAAALDQALADQEERIDDLRGSIAANATLSAALEAEGYTADDVVAVSTSAGGEVTLIVDG